MFRKVCKEHGIKVTPQRLEIFLEVIAASDHPSAEEIFRRVQKKLPTVSLDTVYRTLTTFDEQGLIAKVHFLDDKIRFDPNTQQHHHMICIICGTIMDFAWPKIDAMTLPSEVEGWGTVNERQLLLRGVCSHCLHKINHQNGKDNNDSTDDS
jgi:Fur family peroxide stress response transcriptional regulator